VEFKRQVQTVSRVTKESKISPKLQAQHIYDSLSSSTTSQRENLTDRETLYLLKGVLRHGEHNMRSISKENSLSVSYKALAYKWQAIKL